MLLVLKETLLTSDRALVFEEPNAEPCYMRSKTENISCHFYGVEVKIGESSEHFGAYFVDSGLKNEVFLFLGHLKINLSNFDSRPEFRVGHLVRGSWSCL
jgi:hypothetical protein